MDTTTYREKRYQVFVSSTFYDLKEERNAVIKALLDIDMFPAAMEHFPASDDDPNTYVKQLMQNCDYYILIIGGRYGTLTERGISYTQLEYEIAIELNIPIISFIHYDIDSIPKRNTESDPNREKKLNEFLSLAKNKLSKEWANVDQLKSLVVTSMIKLMKDKPKIGWIRANSITRDHASLLQDSKIDKEEISRLKNELEKYRTISPIETYKDFDKAWPRIEGVLEKEIEVSRPIGEKVKIRCMGLCLHKSFPKIQGFLLRRDIQKTRIEVRLAILDPECQEWTKLNNRWKSLIDVFHIDLENLINKIKERPNLDVSIKLTKYNHMPNFHGLLINKSDLFLSACMWDSRSTLTAGQNAYEHYKMGESDTHNKKIHLYTRWFDYGRYFGSTRSSEALLFDSRKQDSAQIVK